jgi:hypothetical protein
MSGHSLIRKLARRLPASSSRRFQAISSWTAPIKNILTSAYSKEIGESILKHGGEVIEKIRLSYTDMIIDFVAARVDNPDKCGGLLDHQIEIYENYIDQHGKAVNKHRALLT